MIYIVSTSTAISPEILDSENCQVNKTLNFLTDIKIQPEDIFLYHSSLEEQVLISKQQAVHSKLDMSDDYKSYLDAMKNFEEYISIAKDMVCFYLLDTTTDLFKAPQIFAFWQGLCSKYEFHQINNNQDDLENVVLSDYDLLTYLVNSADEDFDLSSQTLLKSMESTLSLLCDTSNSTVLQDCMSKLSVKFEMDLATQTSLMKDLEFSKNLLATTYQNFSELNDKLQAVTNRLQRSSATSTTLTYVPPTRVALEQQVKYGGKLLYIKCFSEVLGLNTFLITFVKFLAEMQSIPCRLVYIFSKTSQLAEKFSARPDFMQLTTANSLDSVLSQISQGAQTLNGPFVFYTTNPEPDLFKKLLDHKAFLNTIFVDMSFMNSTFSPPTWIEYNGSASSNPYKLLYAYSSLSGAFSTINRSGTFSKTSFAPFVSEMVKAQNEFTAYMNFKNSNMKAKADKKLKDVQAIFQQFIFGLPAPVLSRVDTMNKDVLNNLYSVYSSVYDLLAKSKVKNAPKKEVKPCVNSEYMLITQRLADWGLDAFYIPDISHTLMIDASASYNKNFLMMNDKLVQQRLIFYNQTFTELDMFMKFSNIMGLNLKK